MDYMNIGRALLIQSGVTHAKNEITADMKDTALDTLYTRWQWLITYKGIDHADTIACKKQYDAYWKAYKA